MPGGELKMNEPLTGRAAKSGFPPGSLVHVGDVHNPETRLTVLDYNGQGVQESAPISVDQLSTLPAGDGIQWVIVEGLADTQVVEKIGEAFQVHHLVLEDILNTHQRAKFEAYDDYLYLVLKCLIPGKEAFSVEVEQVSVLVFERVVFVFTEQQNELFASVKAQLASGKGRIRTSASDYLAYLLLDTIVDKHFELIDALEDTVNTVEDSLLSSEPTQALLLTIQNLKRDVNNIRRNVSPLRELMNALLRSESPLLHEKTQLYFRDVYDHILRVMESVDANREIITSLLEIYITNVSNRMNEVMKVLTVFASIFIPLTFLTGIYGMNFDGMPELHWRWAYPVLWGLFLILPVALLAYFKRKKWV